MRKFTLSEEEQGKPLVQVVSERLRVSKKQAKRLLDAKCVFVNGKRLWMAQAKVASGDRLEVQDLVVAAPHAPLTLADILYQDSEIIVVNKPPGITTNGEESLETELHELLSDPLIRAVHRLDRDTTGAVIFARTRKLKEQLEEVFRRKAIVKRYDALVFGWVPSECEEIRKPIDGKPAFTKVSIVSANHHATHVKLTLVTGRMHQIRRHMAAIKHPVIGDKEYATERVDFGALRSVARQMLHASSIEFESPFRKERGEDALIAVAAPLPADFVECRSTLQL